MRIQEKRDFESPRIHRALGELDPFGLCVGLVAAGIVAMIMWAYFVIEGMNMVITGGGPRDRD